MRKEEPIYLNGASKRVASPMRDRVGNITREFVPFVPSSDGVADVMRGLCENDATKIRYAVGRKPRAFN